MNLITNYEDHECKHSFHSAASDNFHSELLCLLHVQTETTLFWYLISTSTYAPYVLHSFIYLSNTSFPTTICSALYKAAELLAGQGAVSGIVSPCLVGTTHTNLWCAQGSSSSSR